MCGSMMSADPVAMSGLAWLLPGLFTMLALTLGAVLIATKMGRRRVVPAGEPVALARVKERYARGEIDHAELDRMLGVLLRSEHRTTRGR